MTDIFKPTKSQLAATIKAELEWRLRSLITTNHAKSEELRLEADRLVRQKRDDACAEAVADHQSLVDDLNAVLIKHGRSATVRLSNGGYYNVKPGDYICLSLELTQTIETNHRHPEIPEEAAALREAAAVCSDDAKKAHNALQGLSSVTNLLTLAPSLGDGEAREKFMAGLTQAGAALADGLPVTQASERAYNELLKRFGKY